MKNVILTEVTQCGKTNSMFSFRCRPRLQVLDLCVYLESELRGQEAGKGPLLRAREEASGERGQQDTCGTGKEY